MIKELTEWVSRFDRICEKAFKTRLSHIARLNANPDCQQQITYQPNSLFTLSTSSITSLPEVSPLPVTEEDDTNLKSLKRLLVRKIEPGCSVVMGEVDKMRMWVGVAREVVYGIRRRGL